MARSPNKPTDAAPAVTVATPAEPAAPTEAAPAATAAALTEPVAADPVAEQAPAESLPAATEPAVIAPAPKVAVSAYVAATYIEHDGEPFNIGDPIVLTEKQAEPLLVVKAIKLKGDDNA